MSVSPAYQPLMDELLGFVTQPEHEQELVAGRAEYVHHTGEVFDDDRSFDARMASFLDWFVFDRPLAPWGEPPVRVYPAWARLSEPRAAVFRTLARTVHGIFDLRWAHRDTITVVNLPTGARYRVPIPEPMHGFSRGDLFEGRLVPFERRLCFSPAFIFHPREIRAALVEEVRRQHAERVSLKVQELVFMLSRMATRAEHYRNVKIEAIYDFSRPPPKVGSTPLRFDPESVARRLGRLPNAAQTPA